MTAAKMAKLLLVVLGTAESTSRIVPVKKINVLTVCIAKFIVSSLKVHVFVLMLLNKYRQLVLYSYDLTMAKKG